MTFEIIRTEMADGVGVIYFNRAKALNALNEPLMKEMIQALEDFDEDPSIGAAVLTGDDRAFAAGADIKEMAESSALEMLQADRIAQWDRLRKISIPIVAAVSGWCLGGGNELAMACDMIVASESARFGQPEINLGVIPGAGGTQRLTRAVGKVVAMEVVLNNRVLTAEEAYRWGLVNRVVPVERYLEEAIKLASEIAARAPTAVRLGKEMINHAFEGPLADGLADERRSFYFLFSTEDQKEGMQAFIDKRPPEWKGR